ncbi:MAG: TIGR04552 family protein, partial [Bdellovibrionota bacterium]
MFKKKFEFGWDVLDGIISGGSSIDAKQGLGITSRPVAEDFTRAYGYEPSNPIEQAELLGNFHEAIHFIRRSFLKPDNPDGIASAVPRKILEITDVTDLFLLASDSLPNQDKDPNGALYRDWACCILKVMHTIAHIDKDMRNPYFSEIQKQILDRFYKYVHRGADGVLSLGVREDDSLRVQLVSFESKPKKTRDSILIKLLHKS